METREGAVKQEKTVYKHLNMDIFNHLNWTRTEGGDVGKKINRTTFV